MSSGIEIERKYLLRELPTIPENWIRVDIEQGYLDAAYVPACEDPPGVEHIREGRLRRTVHADGKVIYKHTIKRGMGLVREEIEQELSKQQFEKLWPGTTGMRLRKTRWMWRDGELVWAIDSFLDLDLVLAEVEMPRADCVTRPPEFLADVIEREVTNDREYVNSNIARKLGRRAGN